MLTYATYAFSFHFIFIEKIVLTVLAVSHVVDMTGKEVDIIPIEEEPPAMVPVAVKTEPFTDNDWVSTMVYCINKSSVVANDFAKRICNAKLMSEVTAASKIIWEPAVAFGPNLLAKGATAISRFIPITVPPPIL